VKATAEEEGKAGDWDSWSTSSPKQKQVEASNLPQPRYHLFPRVALPS
jgi:hypothetical protein